MADNPQALVLGSLLLCIVVQLVYNQDFVKLSTQGCSL